MFHPTRVEIDIGDTGHPRPASKSPLGHGAAIGLGPANGAHATMYCHG
jgi:hypothetical protein